MSPRVPAVPQKNGVCASLGEPLLARLLCGIMWVSHSVILWFCLALGVDIPLRILTYKFNSRLFIQIRTVDNLASKSYDQNVNPRRIGSDESRVPAVPRKKNAVYASLEEPFLPSLLYDIMWFSRSIIFQSVYACCGFGIYAACIYSAVLNCARGCHRGILHDYYASTGLSGTSRYSGLIQSNI